MSATTKTYDVLAAIRMYRVQPGDTIELTDKEARSMVAAGWIKPQIAAKAKSGKKED